MSTPTGPDYQPTQPQPPQGPWHPSQQGYQPISYDANTPPQTWANVRPGDPVVPAPKKRRWPLIVAGAVALTVIAAVGATAGGDPAPTAAAPAPAVTVTAPAPQPTPDPTTEAAPAPAPEPDPTEAAPVRNEKKYLRQVYSIPGVSAYKGMLDSELVELGDSIVAATDRGVDKDLIISMVHDGLKGQGVDEEGAERIYDAAMKYLAEA